MNVPEALSGCDALGPTAPAQTPADEALAELRRFHLSGVPSQTLPEGLLPASWFLAAQTHEPRETILLVGAEDDTGAHVVPLWTTFLHRLQESAARSNGATPLGDRVGELQDHVLRLLRKKQGLAPATAVFAEAGRAWCDGIDGADGETLLQEIEAVCSAWGPEANLLLTGEAAILQLMLLETREVYRARRAQIRQQIEVVAELLRAFLAVESAKEDTSRSSQGLQQTMGLFGSSLLDMEKLSRSLGPWRGAPPLPYEQKLRAEEILENLRRALTEPEAPVAVLVHDGTLDTSALSNETDCEIVTHDDPCRGVGDLFEVRARESASLFRDMHIAQLILESRYDPARHDPWFERFDWEGFTTDEYFHLPTIVAVESAERLSARHLPSLSELLLSGKPVQILAWQSPGLNPTNPDEELMQHTRMELGYLGIGHRKPFVQQGSLQQPELLALGYRRALESPHPALHVLARSQPSSAVEATLQAEIAVTSRAHPLFRFNPEAGSSWSTRMDFAGNPDPHKDWPDRDVAITVADGGARQWQLPCTFADCALLESSLRHHFMRIPDDCRSEDLVRLDVHLQQVSEDTAHQLPWIWACDAQGNVLRLLVSRRLVRACRDRLDYWHTLQELAGIHNRYVEAAIERTREEERVAYSAELQRLQGEHASALNELERQTVKRSMRRLARMLLDLDPLTAGAAPADAPVAAATTRSATAAPSTEATPVAAEAATAAAEAAEPEAPAAAEEEEIDEPWIDSVLCTSCNDCLQINAKMFVYNDNKQATIGDASAGTFEQLVRAAEKCPARCIHPGKPLNPQEPNLESLIQRAAPFN
jgi:ferredoxin